MTLVYEYQLSRDDIWRFNKYLMWRTPSSRFNLITTCLAFPVLGIIFLRVLEAPLMPAIIIGLIVGVIGIIAYWWLLRRQVMSLPSDKGNQLGRRTLSISPDGVAEVTAFSEERYRWQGVLSIVSQRDCVFVLVDANKAHVIPSRVFNSVQEQAVFVDTAIRYWKEAVGEDK